MANKKCTLYKYMSTKYLLDVVENQRLYMANFNQLNDPFDLHIVDGGEDKEIDNLRILCLTNSSNRNKMWSYYADGHKGVCITVELPIQYVYSVCYTKELVRTDTNLNDIFSNMKNKTKANLKKTYDMDDQIKIGYIKNSQFSDEVEYRVVTLNDYADKYIIDENNEKFFKVKIKRIYLGNKFEDDELYQKLKKICDDKKIAIVKMVKNPNKYQLKPEPFKM